MKKCKVLPLPSKHCFSSPSVVQCPCWRSCVHCSSWGSVPKCTNPLTFMLAVTSDHFHHPYVNVNYQCAWRLWVQQPATPRSARPSYWCTHPGMNLHEMSLKFCQALRVYVGLKLGKKPWWWGQERHVACPCACVCVIALRWSSSLRPGSGCMWDLMSAYQLTTHMSLRRGCSSLLTETLWNVAYEKSKTKCFCNIMWGKTNVGVHENIQASLLTQAGGETGVSVLL